MKKLLLIFFLLFLMVGSAPAQQVLGPAATGTAIYYTFYDTDLGYYVSGYETKIVFGVGRSYGLTITHSHYVFKTWDAVMEFDISGVTPAGVTAANFRSARLDGLKVVESGFVGTTMPVLLYDMFDIDEDGSITTDDYHSMRGSGTTLFTTIPSVGTTFNNIDVTDALLNDLFGAGTTTSYCGFILIRYPGSIPSTIVKFDDKIPTLTIFIKRAQSAVNFLLLKD